MRLLLVHPGAEFSTADVERGLRCGLEAHGAEVLPYRLDWRLEQAKRYLEWAWAQSPERERPTWPDAVWRASKDVVLEALRLNVDAVLVVSGMYLALDALLLLQRAQVTTGLLLTESPYDLEQEMRWAALASCVWTNERTCVPALRLANPRTSYLPHAWDPTVHDATAPIPADTPAHDVVFVGTAFQERIDLLEAVDWTGIDLGLYGNWDLLGPESPLRPFVRAETIPNTQAAALYRNAKIGLNLYRQSVGYGAEAPRITTAESLNPRAYELAALGAFTLSEARAEVWERFDLLVPTFRHADWLERLVRVWLDEPTKRAAVAAQLPACVAGDTWTERAGQALSDLNRYGASRDSTALVAP